MFSSFRAARGSKRFSDVHRLVTRQGEAPPRYPLKTRPHVAATFELRDESGDELPFVSVRPLVCLPTHPLRDLIPRRFRSYSALNAAPGTAFAETFHAFLRRYAQDPSQRDPNRYDRQHAQHHNAVHAI
jgi:hypothetical protein